VYTASRTHKPRIDDPQHKRRRLHPSRQGPVSMNARFDRMLERVNVKPLGTPQESSSPWSTRKRRRSASSISGSSDPAPPTPVDAYAALEGGRLGDGFMVFKFKGRKGLDQLSSDASEVNTATYSLCTAYMRHFFSCIPSFAASVLSSGIAVFAYHMAYTSGPISHNSYCAPEVPSHPGSRRLSPLLSRTTLFESLPLPQIRPFLLATRMKRWAIQLTFILNLNMVSPRCE
jgi:hypothetical protein